MWILREKKPKVCPKIKNMCEKIQILANNMEFRSYIHLQ